MLLADVAGLAAEVAALGRHLQTALLAHPSMVPAATDRATATNRLMRCLVGLDDAARDAASLRHLVAVLVRPLADRLGVQVALGPGSRGGASRGAGPTPTTAESPAVLDVEVEGLTQGDCVLAGQVDLVVASVECEGDRLVCGLAVRVIRELSHDSLRHKRMVGPSGTYCQLERPSRANLLSVAQRRPSVRAAPTDTPARCARPPRLAPPSRTPSSKMTVTGRAKGRRSAAEP